MLLGPQYIHEVFNISDVMLSITLNITPACWQLSKKKTKVLINKAS